MKVKVTKTDMKEAVGGLLQALGWFIGATAVVCLVLLALDVMDTDLELWQAALRMALLLIGSGAEIVLGRKLYPPKKKKAKQAPRPGQTAAKNCCARCGVDLKLLKASRKGLNADTIDALSRFAPRRNVYVSCDPATLARDVALLKSKGYVLKNALAADLFPRCSHVESIVCLTRDFDNGKTYQYITEK